VERSWKTWDEIRGQYQDGTYVYKMRDWEICGSCSELFLVVDLVSRAVEFQIPVTRQLSMSSS